MRTQIAQLWQHRIGVLWLLVVLVTAVALVLSVAGRLDVASFILTVAVLLITSLALQAAWLTPARLVLERQQELRHTGDLMFWTYNQPDVPEGLLPAEAKLDMYMAVANVGGRKALLLGLSLEDYLDALGQPVRSLVLPAPVLAYEYRQWEERDLLAGGNMPRFLSEKKMPPFVLEPDEVLSLRLRATRSVEYGHPAEVRVIARQLATPITQGRLLLIYRRGQQLVRETVVVPLVTDAQDYFVNRLAIVTKEFTEVPALQRQQVVDNESGFPIAR